MVENIVEIQFLLVCDMIFNLKNMKSDLMENPAQAPHLQQFTLQGYDATNIKQIGSGNYAKIYKIKSIKLNIDVAIKQIDMVKLRKQNQLHSLIEQIELMKKLKCEEIVEYIESSIGSNYSYIVMELCECDLRKEIKHGKANLMPEDKCVQIFLEVIKGLRVFVENSYIHRDLKPENIFVKNNKHKIGDFGFAVRADLNCHHKIEGVCGTPIYMAPQLLNNQPYSAKSDIWSLGLILYEMIYGCTPWPVKCLDNYRVIMRKRPLAFPFDVRIGKDTKDFLKKSIVVEEQYRMNWQQLFQHPLIKNKVPGQITIPREIAPKVRKIFSKIQLEAKRKLIDIVQTFQAYDNLTTLTQPQFEQLLSKLNPTITTHETKLMFEACDKNNNNQIDKNQFKSMFCEVNYSMNHCEEKQIDEIFGIICVKGVQVKDLFQQFDSNNNGTLNFQEFANMIKHIAPGYGLDSLQIVFGRIDKNNDGLISKKQFVKSIGGGLITQKNYIGLWLEKVVRNMKILKQHLKQKRLTAETIIKLSDFNADEQLDIKQFTHFMDVIEFSISHEEILDIFKVLDRDSSGKITLEEIQNFYFD